MSDEQLPRGLELAADEALQGLCPNEWVEFDAAFPPDQKRELLLTELEVLVAEIAVAETQAEKMPAHLQERIAATCETISAPQAPPSRGKVVAFPEKKRALPEVARSAGWLVAAAVALAFWFDRSSGRSQPDPTREIALPEQPAQELPPKKLLPAEERQALLEKGSTRRVDWTTTQDPAAQGMSGDLVWDSETRQGFMRFHGLPANDPTQLSYQLWIFDAERDDAHPVDGGVFDVLEQGEVVVKIDPRVPVHRAKLFAVTVERPGGVVVSKRERIVVTAALPPT